MRYNVLMPRCFITPILLAGLVFSLCACSKSVPPVPAPPDLGDLSRMDPAAVLTIREKHDAVTSNLNDAVARSELAMTCQAHDMNEIAVASYEQALRLDPNRPRWWYLLAQAQKDLGLIDDALASMQRSLQLDPTYPAAHSRRGFWLLELGRFEEAAQSFADAIEQDPTYVNGLAGMARVNLQRGETQAAITRLESLHAQRPDDPYFSFLLGTAYRQAGRLDEARLKLQVGAGSQLSWRGLDPWTGDMQLFERGFRVEYEKAQRLLAARRSDDAITFLTSMLEMYPEKVPVLTSLAGAYSSSGRFEEALVHLNRALAIDPEHFVVHLNLGSVYNRQEVYDKALEHTDEAIRLNPTLGQAHFQRGQILFGMRRLADAETSLKRAIEYDPQIIRAYLLLAHTLKSQDKFQETITLLETIIERFPNVPDGFLLLGKLHQEQGRPLAAREIITLAARRFPDHPQILQFKQVLGIP